MVKNVVKKVAPHLIGFAGGGTGDLWGNLAQGVLPTPDSPGQGARRNDSSGVSFAKSNSSSRPGHQQFTIRQLLAAWPQFTEVRCGFGETFEYNTDSPRFRIDVCYDEDPGAGNVTSSFAGYSLESANAPRPRIAILGPGEKDTPGHTFQRAYVRISPADFLSTFVVGGAAPIPPVYWRSWRDVGDGALAAAALAPSVAVQPWGFDEFVYFTATAGGGGRITSSFEAKQQLVIPAQWATATRGRTTDRGTLVAGATLGAFPTLSELLFSWELKRYRRLQLEVSAVRSVLDPRTTNQMCPRVNFTNVNGSPIPNLTHWFGSALGRIADGDAPTVYFRLNLGSPWRWAVEGIVPNFTFVGGVATHAYIVQTRYILDDGDPHMGEVEEASMRWYNATATAPGNAETILLAALPLSHKARSSFCLVGPTVCTGIFKTVSPDDLAIAASNTGYNNVNTVLTSVNPMNVSVSAPQAAWVLTTTVGAALARGVFVYQGNSP